MTAYYSNLAMVTSAVLYLIAMTAHAAEWASAMDDDALSDAERRRIAAEVLELREACDLAAGVLMATGG